MFEKTPIEEKSWRGALKRLALKIKNYPFLYKLCTAVIRFLRRAIRFVLGRRHHVDIKISNQRRKYESETTFDRDIKFSILVPLYNTPKNFLAEMIESVQNQTYSNWQLCLADGSDDSHAYVGEYINSLNEPRISYVKLTENKGISENTNACIVLASGDYIALFDHDDLLHPSVLYKMMQVICEKNADFIYTDEVVFFGKNTNDVKAYHYKPDFSPDTLRSYNYICHFSAFSKELLAKSGGRFNSECDGSQDFDMMLRLSEKAECIYHIREPLYFWRSHAASVASDVSAKPYTVTAAKLALKNHLERIGLDAEVEDAPSITTYKIQYKINGDPLVSIVIANKDHIDDLDQCLTSIYEKSTYKNFEVIIAENNSTEEKTFDYYKTAQDKYSNLKVITWDKEFNYSAINNFAEKQANGDYILLLNNDIEVITNDWIEQMLMFAQRPDVGAVGAKLYYPDNTIQHAGVIVGLGGVAGHAHKNFDRYDYGYMARASIAQNLSACTAACLMIRRDVYEQVGGLDESYAVAFNDIDFCLKIREAGYLIVFTPFAELYHYESKSRGYEDTRQKRDRYNGEVIRFQNKWTEFLKNGDPYYNPNLSLDTEDFALK
ncbi:MAG: glycosyltransferase family 2 protein [Clostridia bacterium]|nr:glycosyltransferase family 2 protein [Clostridia bacterium]